MVTQSDLLFHTEAQNEEEFVRRAKAAGFDSWTRKAKKSGLVVFQFRSLKIEEIKKLLDATGDLNAKRAYFGGPPLKR